MVRLKKQKVRSRKKKASSTQKSSKRFKTVIKFFITVVLVGGIGIGFVSLKYMFVDLGYFIIKGVDLKLYDEDGSLRDLSVIEIADEEVVGENIFFVDLNALKEKVEAGHPGFKDIVIRRLLPNKLVVQASLRKAIAQIRSNRYYPVDAEGVLLPDVKNFPDPDIPIISGIGVNVARLKSSKFSKFEKEKIKKALGLIKEMQAIEDLSEYKLKAVDIADPGNFSFFLERSNVEIKIGNSDFHNRLKVLSTLLEQIGSDIDKFKYIDLRFEDPIIGHR